MITSFSIKHWLSEDITIGVQFQFELTFLLRVITIRWIDYNPYMFIIMNCDRIRFYYSNEWITIKSHFYTSFHFICWSSVLYKIKIYIAKWGGYNRVLIVY